MHEILRWFHGLALFCAASALVIASQTVPPAQIRSHEVKTAGPGAAASEPWRVTEQPELKQALEQAPVLQTESLGEPARGVNTWEHWLVPNPDGKTWDVLQLYFKQYYGPTWLYAMDLGTGQVKKQRLPDKRQFYLSGRALGFDGRYYVATPGPGGSGGAWGMFMHVYDPAANSFEDRGEIVPGLSGEVRPLAVGPDGRIYGTGSYSQGKLGLYIYDPKLGKVVKNFGAVGPSHANGAWSSYALGVDDTHAYLASGMIPWYLVAINLKTGDEKVLLQSPTEQRMEILESFPGAWVIVPQNGTARKEYWLYHGEAISKMNNTLPWPTQASPWDKAAPKPKLYRDQIDPDAAGNATLWYRLAEDAAKASKNPVPDAKAEDLGWRSIRLAGIEAYSHRIGPLALLSDGRLHGAAGDYVGSFNFDPKTDKATLLGRNQGLSPYTYIAHGDKLYSSGYPGGPLFTYDPRRPWTPHKGGPPGHPAPPRDDPASNPRLLGELDRATRVAIAHSSAFGADGKLYFGGFGERHYTGGGFGWYDPKTKKLDGFWKPLSGYAVHYLTPALEARLILISTSVAPDELNGNRVPEEAKLFFFDVEQGKIAHEIVPVPKARATGLIIEVAAGRFLGLTADREHPGASVLYGADVTTGDVLFRKALPWPVGTDAYWPHWVDPQDERLDLVRGPDGFVWSYLKNALVRIDPNDATVHVVGKIDPPGRPMFVGRDLYLAGAEQLRRIRNVAGNGLER